MRTTAAAWVLGVAAISAACASGGGERPPAGAAAPATNDAGALFARFRAATGGARWDGVASLASEGTLTAGGLSGPITALVDARTGRSVAHYHLGPVEGAEGYDGTTSWEQDPGGEVTALGAPEARALARTEAWMNAQGYFHLDRAKAALSAVHDAGAGTVAVDATPEGGQTITLVFDARSALLVRTIEKRGADTVTNTFDDYRDAGGVRVPFHVVTDSTDAAGRTDPRARTELHLARVTLGAPAADGDFAMPAMRPGATIAAASGETRIPFDLVNNHIYADATIDGTRVRVVVDTGGVDLVTPAAAARLGLSQEGKLQGRGVGDEHVDVALARGKELRFGDVVLPNPVFYVIDLGPMAEGEGTPSDGLVGFEIFRRFRVTIDYAARVLTLTDPARFVPPANAHVVPFELADRIPIVQGTLDDVPVRLSIDTGSRSSLSMHSPFVRAHDLVSRYGAAPEAIVGWGVGGPSRGRPARLGALRLADVTVNDVSGDLYTGDKGAFANPDLSGNLGGGVLRRFTVTFDYDAKKMYLAPNEGFAKPDDFDRSGLWLFADGDALKVVGVAPESAAAAAGLHEGDRIVKVAGEAASARPLAEWRARLCDLPAGTKLVLTVARPPGEAEVPLVLADRIPPHAKAR